MTRKSEKEENVQDVRIFFDSKPSMLTIVINGKFEDVPSSDREVSEILSIRNRE
jgi:hypothetical protein